jgi:hypothetical protein
MTIDRPRDEEKEFCPACFAHDCALELLDKAVVNAIAAGCEPDEIYDRLTDTLYEWFGGSGEPGELTEGTPTTGAA